VAQALMEAGNRGAVVTQAGNPIGLNIVLPFERRE